MSPSAHVGTAPSTTLATRRELLVGALALSSACRSSKAPEPAEPDRASRSTPTNEPAPSAAVGAVDVTGADEPPPLQVVRRGDLPDTARGGTAVVLLHGWGASGDDLVSLAERLAQPRSRFFVPAAPLPHGAGGRAWWEISDRNRPAHAWDDTLPAAHRPNAQVSRARRAVQNLLRDIRERYAPERLVLAGFSQGAMLTLDVALAANPPVDRAAALSGVLLADSLPALLGPHAARPRFFVSHGKADSMLRFAGSERATELLTKHGFAVQFHAFAGGHEIPSEVVSALRQFIYSDT